MENNLLVIDIDPNRKIPIILSNGERLGRQVKLVEESREVLDDMAIICEAICTLIHLPKKKTKKKTQTFLTECINHLKFTIINPTKINLSNLTKDILSLEVDVDRKKRVKIVHLRPTEGEANNSDFKADSAQDMFNLLEALATIILLDKQAKSKDSNLGFHYCIKHLERGFMDATYWAYTKKKV